MLKAAPGDVTRLLLDCQSGTAEALERLMPLVYRELRRVADSALARERAGHLLQPTALVHETYLKLVDQRRTDWKNRAHFFAISARLMRRILIDHARKRQANKRGGKALTLSLDEALEVPGSGGPKEVDLLTLNRALEALERLDARQCRVVELRFFTGLTLEETAQALEVSVATVKVDWKMARSWLFRELVEGSAAS